MLRSRACRARALLAAALALLVVGAAAPSAEGARIIDDPAASVDRCLRGSERGCPSLLPADRFERGRERRRADRASRSRRDDPPADDDAEPAPPDTGTSDASANAPGPGIADPWSTLGFNDPLCRHAVGSQARRNCETSGSVASPYWLSNHALDVNVDPGANPLKAFRGMLHELLGALWLFAVYLLKGILNALQWAFGVDVFRGAAMSATDLALERVYRTLDAPFFRAVLGAIGLWAIWVGLLRRRSAQMLGGVALSVGLIVLTMWIIHSPRATVGRLSALSNDVAMVVIAAPLSAFPPGEGERRPAGARISAPREALADEVRYLFRVLVREPWAALNFADADWAAKPPSPAERQLAKEVAETEAVKDAALVDAVAAKPGVVRRLRAIDEEEARKEELERLVREHAGRVGINSRADMWLRYSGGSAPRRALYEAYSGKKSDTAGGRLQWLLAPGLALGRRAVEGILERIRGGESAGIAPEKVAIQGDGGTFVRIGLLLVVALGFLGALLLFGWLALRLVWQAALAFVLLLLAPFAFFLAALGESGRQSFLAWLRGLLGALVSKVVYAGLLAICLCGVRVIQLAGGGSRFAMAFLLQSLFFWVLFLARESLLGFISVRSGDGGHSGPSFALTRGLLTARLLKQTAGELAGSPARAGRALNERVGGGPSARAESRLARRRDSAEAKVRPVREGAAAAEEAGARERIGTHDETRQRLRSLDQTAELRDYDAGRERERAMPTSYPFTPTRAQEKLAGEREALRAEERRMRPQTDADRRAVASFAANQRTHGSRVAPHERAEWNERITREWARDPRAFDRSQAAPLLRSREPGRRGEPMSAAEYGRLGGEARQRADREIDRELGSALAAVERPSDPPVRSARPSGPPPVPARRRGGREHSRHRERARSNAGIGGRR